MSSRSGALGGIRTPNLLIRKSQGRLSESSEIPSRRKHAGQHRWNLRVAKHSGTGSDALRPNCWLKCWLSSRLFACRFGTLLATLGDAPMTTHPDTGDLTIRKDLPIRVDLD